MNCKTISGEFWKHCDPDESGCWIWNHGKTTGGYGLLCFLGVNFYAHRFAWELKHGPVPSGLYVCHKCDVPPCVNPDHLFLGTAKENAQDAVGKGRFEPQIRGLRKFWAEKGHLFRGEAHPDSKLTTAQVLEMRQLHDRDGWGYKRLSKKFGVSCSVSKRIVKRVAWRSV